MSNKIAALTVAFNETNLLEACVRQFKRPYLEKDMFHMVLVSNKPWHGNHEYDKDTFMRAFKADFVQVDDWPNQAEQFNWGLEHLSGLGFDWAIICDADEYYTRHDFGMIVHDISTTNADAIKVSDMRVYWKLPIFRIAPDQYDNPIVAIKTNKKFISKRHAEVSYDFTNATLYHFSYVRTNQEMKKKIESFEHSNEFDILKWYNDVWISGAKFNLHPVVPEQFQRYYYDPPSREILNNFYDHKEYFQQG